MKAVILIDDKGIEKDGQVGMLIEVQYFDDDGLRVSYAGKSGVLDDLPPAHQIGTGLVRIACAAASQAHMKGERQ